MSSIPILRNCVRSVLLPGCQRCRCLSSLPAQQQRPEQNFERVTKRRQKVMIVTEEEAARLQKATDSQLVRQSAFHDELVNKFTNCMMWDGKKSVAREIMRSAFERIKEIQLEKKHKSSEPEKVETNPLTIFYTAVENSKPIIGCQTMKKGGKNYSVPTPLPDSRRRFLAIKWLITAARDQSGPRDARMYNKLAKELLDAYNNEGAVIKKKTELHKVAEANRAFAHFRWW